MRYQLKKWRTEREKELIFRSGRNNGIQVNIAAASWHIEQDIIYSEKSVVGKKNQVFSLLETELTPSTAFSADCKTFLRDYQSSN